MLERLENLDDNQNKETASEEDLDAEMHREYDEVISEGEKADL